MATSRFAFAELGGLGLGVRSQRHNLGFRDFRGLLADVRSWEPATQATIRPAPFPNPPPHSATTRHRPRQPAPWVAAAARPRRAQTSGKSGASGWASDNSAILTSGAKVWKWTSTMSERRLLNKGRGSIVVLNLFIRRKFAARPDDHHRCRKTAASGIEGKRSARGHRRPSTGGTFIGLARKKLGTGKAVCAMPGPEGRRRRCYRAPVLRAARAMARRKRLSCEWRSRPGCPHRSAPGRCRRRPDNWPGTGMTFLEEQASTDCPGPGW